MANYGYTGPGANTSYGVLASDVSPSSSSSKGFLSSLGNLFGGGDGGFASSGWGMLAQGILGGIGASSAASDQRRMSREAMEAQRRAQQEAIRSSGDEQRRTIDFETRLNEANRLNERARLATAWSNWDKQPATQTTKPVTLPNFADYYVAPTPEPTKPGKK